MLVIGARIQESEDETSTPIEELEVGQCIYDPVKDQNQFIVKMLKKQVVPAYLNHMNRDAYAPVRIFAHALGKDMPSMDLLVSSEQLILVGDFSRGLCGYNERSAISLCATGAARHEVERINLPVTYFVPLFSAPAVFRANGLMLYGCSINDIVHRSNRKRLI